MNVSKNKNKKCLHLTVVKPVTQQCLLSVTQVPNRRRKTEYAPTIWVNFSIFANFIVWVLGVRSLMEVATIFIVLTNVPRWRILLSKWQRQSRSTKIIYSYAVVILFLLSFRFTSCFYRLRIAVIKVLRSALKLSNEK